MKIYVCFPQLAVKRLEYGSDHLRPSNIQVVFAWTFPLLLLTCFENVQLCRMYVPIELHAILFVT